MQFAFGDILKGKVAIVGIGNIMRADDALGPCLIESLKGKIRASCIDAGVAPENYIGKIVKEEPDTILIIDAVHLGRRPGEYEILKGHDIIKSGFTTHDISPAMFIEYLEKETKADIYMLGVEPQDVELGCPMSDCIKKTLLEIAGLILEASRA